MTAPRQKRRTRRRLRFRALLPVLLFSALGACTTAPEPSPPAGPDGRLLRSPAGLLEDTLPAIRLGIARLLADGHADRASRSDFYHLHIVAPLSRIAPYPVPAEFSAGLGFLFHTKERPHEIREEWLEELALVRDPLVEGWLAVIRDTDFDYQDFFYGSGRIRSRGALPEAQLFRIAEAWKKQRPIAASLDTLRDRVVYIHGSRQPGYEAAAKALFWPRSFLTRVSDPDPVPVAVHPGRWVPVATVYFSPAPDDGSKRAGPGTGSAPGRVAARYWGYDFVLVPSATN